MAMHKRFGTAARHRMLGITLLELMIVVLVIGVLGVIALPSYRQYVMRSHRTEAKNALLLIQTNQERFYLANRTYSNDPTVLGFPTGRTERGTYTLAIAGANAVGYTATATPRAGNNPDQTADVDCTSFSITAQSVKTHTGNPATACW